MPTDIRHRIGLTARSALAAAVLATALPLAANAAALRVVQDPQTGELRAPTAAEADAFAKAEAALRASSGVKAASRSAAPKEVRYADGTIETKLDEDTMMYSVVAEQPDGSLAMECLQADAAKKFVKATSAKKKTPIQSHAKAVHDHS